MAADSAIYVKIDSDTKRFAESIIRDLGLTPSAVISMLYRQIILTHGLPFNVRLPIREPISIDGMTDEEIGKLIDEGVRDVEAGRVYSLEEAKEILEKGYGFTISKHSTK